MKRVPAYLLLTVTLGSGLASCADGVMSPDPSDPAHQTHLSAAVRVDAHPAFVYTRSDRVWQKGAWVDISSVSVADSDGTDAAKIYTSGSASVVNAAATWSASGASVSFVEGPTGRGWGTYRIRGVDVAVSTKQAVVASNSRTIYTALTSDSLKILGQAWCPATGVNRIAFIGYRPGEWGVYTIATSGGTATKIYSVSSSSGSLGDDIAWSSDGSKLAFVETSGSSTTAIRIIGISGAVEATLVSGTYQYIAGLQWSHSGADVLSFSATLTGVVGGGPSGTTFGRDIYIVPATAGSTATCLAAGQTRSDGATSMINPQWSPNNSEIIYLWTNVTYYPNGSSGAGWNTKKVDVASATISDVGQLAYGDWK